MAGQCTVLRVGRISAFGNFGSSTVCIQTKCYQSTDKPPLYRQTSCSSQEQRRAYLCLLYCAKLYFVLCIFSPISSSSFLFPILCIFSILNRVESLRESARLRPDQTFFFFAGVFLRFLLQIIINLLISERQ